MMNHLASSSILATGIVLLFAGCSSGELPESGNLPPVASDVDVATNRNVAVEVLLAATDSDGDSLTYAIVSAPSNGVLSMIDGGKVEGFGATW